MAKKSSNKESQPIERKGKIYNPIEITPKAQELFNQADIPPTEKGENILEFSKLRNKLKGVYQESFPEFAEIEKKAPSAFAEKGQYADTVALDEAYKHMYIPETKMQEVLGEDYDRFKELQSEFPSYVGGDFDTEGTGSDSGAFGIRSALLNPSYEFQDIQEGKSITRYNYSVDEEGNIKRDLIDAYVDPTNTYLNKALQQDVKAPKLEQGSNSKDSALVEVEKDELVLQEDEDGAYTLIYDFKQGDTHEEGGEPYVKQPKDIVFPSKLRTKVINAIRNEDWEEIDELREQLPKTLPEDKELEEGLDSLESGPVKIMSPEEAKEKTTLRTDIPAAEDTTVQPPGVDPLVGMRNFIKSDMERSGVEFTDDKFTKILDTYDNDYDKVIEAVAQRNKIKDPEAFRTQIYDHFQITPYTEEQQPIIDEEAESNYFKDIGQSLLKGVSSVSQGIVRLPSTIYRIAALPQNILSNIPGLEGMEVSKTKNSDILNFLDENQITEYYDEAVEQQSEKLKAYEQSATEQWKSGDKTGALKTIGVQAVESIPLTALLMMSGGAGAATEAGVGIGSYATGQKMHELDKRNPNMNEAIRVTNSILTGAAEAGSEAMSMGSIGIGKKLLQKEGADGLKRIMKTSFIETLSPKLGSIYNIASPMIGEGLTEAASQYSENYIDRISGVDPDVNLMDGVMDAFLVGTVAGGTMSAPISIHNEVVTKPIVRSRVKNNYKKATDNLNDIANSEYVEAMEFLVNNHKSTEETLNNLRDVNRHFADQVSLDNMVTGSEYISSSLNYYNTNNARKRAINKKIAQNIGSDGNVTLTYYKGQPYSVTNPQDLGPGNENKAIFLRTPDGQTKTVISSQIKQWEAKDPNQVSQEQLNQEDAVDDQLTQAQQVQENAAQRGLIEGRTVNTPDGKRTLQSINPDNTATVVNNKGEESIVNTEEIEAYKTQEQKDAEKVEQEADLAVMEGIDQGAEVVADEPLYDGSDVRVIDFSNGQSKIITPEGEQVFDTREERDSAVSELAQGEMEATQETIDDMPPEQAFSTMLKEDPDNPEIATEIFTDEINDIRSQAEESRKQAKEAKTRKEKQALLIQAKQLDAEAMRLDAILQDPSLMEQQIQEEVIEEQIPEQEEVVEPTLEETTAQLKSEYEQETDLTPYNQLLPWQQQLLGSRINPESFKRFADVKTIGKQIAKRWFGKESAQNIDQVAQELSELGIEVSPQDIVDFIMSNPNNSVRKTTDKMNQLANEYRELTGESIKKQTTTAPEVDPDVPFRTQGVNVSERAEQDIKTRKNALKELNKLQEQFGIPIEVINSEELSPEAKAKARLIGTPKAYYQNGKAYILSDQIDSVSDVKKSYLHESVLHAGLDFLFNAGPVKILGKTFETKNDLLDEVFNRLDEETIADRAKAYGIDLTELNDVQKREIAEEALATVSETDSPRMQALLDKLYNYIKKLFGFTSKQFSKADLRNMLREHKDLIIKQKQDAESLRKDEGQVQEGRDVREESAAKSSEDLQQQKEARTKASDTEQVKFRATPSKVNENLVVLHNLNADNIINIDKVGGLPVPSLAVARTDIPFTSYGDISLIADKSMIDPQGYGQARTFNADIYSPRYPSITYDINDRQFDAVFDEVNKLAQDKYDFNPISVSSLGLENDGLRRLQDQEVAKLAFLQEIGKAPRPKKKKANIEPELHKYIKKGYVDQYQLEKDPEFIKDVTKSYERIDSELGGNRFVKDGKVNENLLRRAASQVSHTNALVEPDMYANRTAINDKLKSPKLKNEYNQWIKDKFESMVDQERIFKGFTPSGSRRYIPHTLDNVVKELTKGLQGEEGTFYGVGSVRSGAAKEFKSIEDIQSAREDIVSSEKMAEIKDEINPEFDDILELLKPYYKYDTDGWSYSSSAGESLLEYAKKGRSADFKAFPKAVKNEVGNFLNKLKTLPTEYFESKVQRAVGLDEFTAAVVPKDTPQDVIDILEKNNVKIKKYNPKTEGDRLKKVELSSRQEGVRFRVDEVANTKEIANPDYWKGKTFGYIHNTTPSPNMGSQFGQDIEPSGKYVTMGYGFIPQGHQEGTVSFNNPLVIDVTDTDYVQWKRDLSDLNGSKKKKALSNKLIKDGYDSIITVEEYKGKYYPSETIILDDEIDSNKGSRELEPKFRVAESPKELEDFVKDSKVKETVYHGTGTEFSEFDKSKAGTSIGYEGSDLGFFFTDNIEDAKTYANLTDSDQNIIMKNRINLVNPKMANYGDLMNRDKIIEAIKKGHDGMIDEGTGHYMAFEPSQILIEPQEDVKFRVENTYNSILSKIGDEKLNAYFKDNDLSNDDIQDALSGVDNYWIDQFLEDEYQISINNNGLVQFDELTDEARDIIGNNPILMYHHTSTGVIDDIKANGLKETGIDVNRQGEAEKGVYLTTRYSGTEVDGYKNNAVQTHGGNPVTLEVKTTIDELIPDVDDADISSGRYQFTVDNVSPQNILNLQDGDVKFRVEEQREQVDTNPSEAQKESGNYKMGHIQFDGFDISIENPKGSIRSGQNAQGDKWSNIMPSDYGYFKGTESADGDHVDVFLGDNLNSDKVYVVDQVNEDGSFDEHKVMMGFDNISQARNAYNEAYDEGWQGLGAITRTSKDGLKEWFKGDTTKPFSGYKKALNTPASRIAKTTKEFNYFAKDSKIKKELYHGSDGYFEGFKKGLFGAIYFTSDKELADNYGKNTYVAKVNISNPMYVKDGESWAKALDGDAINKGHDGVVYPSSGVVAVFDNQQILINPKSVAKRISLPKEEVKFRVQSENPQIQKMLDKLQEVQKMSRVAGVRKDLRQEASAFPQHREEIMAQLDDFLEGAKRGRSDTKKEIKAIQDAIVTYAKQYLPLTEAGNRDVNSVLSLVKNSQTPAAMEKAFKKIDELTVDIIYKTERKKNVAKVNRLLKWMTGFKKSGNRKVGKFNYEDTKAMQELKKVNDDVARLNKVSNSYKSSAEQKMQAETEMDEMWNNFNNKADKSDLDNAMMKLIELRRLGSKASPKLAQMVSEELEAIYNKAKEARSDADMNKALTRREDKEMIKSFLASDSNVDELPWFKKAMKQINTKTADWMGNWETLLTMMGGTELRDKYSLLLHEADMATGKQESTNNILDEAKSIYDVDSRRKTLDKVHELSKEEYSLREPNVKGEAIGGTPMKLSKLHLMDIYNAIKNEDIAYDYYMSYGDITMNEDGSRNTEAQYTDGKERIDNLVNKLSAEDMQFADAMQTELDKYYDKLNEIHITLFNRDLPRVENYWPSTAKREVDIDIMEQAFIDSRHPSAANERNAHRTPEPRDAFNKFSKHVEEAEWYSNMALPINEINKAFSDLKVQKQIKDARGDKFNTQISDAIKNVGLVPPSKGVPKSELEKGFNALLGNWVTSKIGATPTVPIKQLLSSINYAENMPTGEWAKGFVKGLSNPKKTWQEMMEIPYLKARLGDGYSEAVQRALNGDESVHKSKVNNAHQAFKNLMTIGTRYGDITAVIFGGKPYLDYLIEKEGLSEKEAVDKFLQDTLRSQQSPFSSSLSKFQNSKNVFARSVFAFANTPSQYMRKLFEANQDLRVKRQQFNDGKISEAEFKKARKQARKAHEIYGIVNSIVFTTVGAMMGGLMKGTDWDDELWKDILVQIEQSYIGGLPVFKDLIGGATKAALGMKVYDDSKPILEGLDQVATAGIKLMSGEAKNPEREYENVAQGFATTIGIPYYNMKKTINAFSSEYRQENKAKQSNDKLNEIKKGDDKRSAEAATDLKQTYSNAKSKATKIRKDGRNNEADRIERMIEQSKVRLHSTDYSAASIKREEDAINRRLDRIR